MANSTISHDESQSPSSSVNNDPPAASKKRTSTSAGLDANGNPKTIKRRAAKACSNCRSRKVRCDVMQKYHVTSDGKPTCSNCTMDDMPCILVASKRRKKNQKVAETASPRESHQNHSPSVVGDVNIIPVNSIWQDGIVNPSDLENPNSRRWSSTSSIDAGQDFSAPHVEHSLYQKASAHISSVEFSRRQSYMAVPSNRDTDAAVSSLLGSASMSGDRTKTRLESSPPPLLPPSAAALFPPAPILKYKLPDYLKPLPQRMTSVDIDYLYAKGALSLPETPIRNALLRAYIEYVHPYMPLIELHELLQIINDVDGTSGKISLLLFQAIMFAGTAFVDMDYLRMAGYPNRKAARKAFFQKSRVLYDFDYEVDRISLVQSLLLMTYWYETPDDQKDTWHWMGVAISLAHTIGLHRNPDNSNMDSSKKKLWKRIWWSCFMRDRLIALGMRRPTRVKDEDYDVPMLTVDDFEIQALSSDNTVISNDCTLIRDVEAQRKLALMCIAKAKLCLCISHVLGAQYSVLVKNQGMQEQEGNTRSSVMLFPKKHDQTDEVQKCDRELSDWVSELPEVCQYSNDIEGSNSGPPMFVQRSLLHMVYFTTLSALHRPQVLPSSNSNQPGIAAEMQDISRKKVREASREITRISLDLHTEGLEKYLPTTGVTVLLPAIIIHLLDIKSCNDEARQAAMEGFTSCMIVLERLRDNYSSADFATQFLEAAIKKADIGMMLPNKSAAPTPARPAFDMSPRVTNAQEFRRSVMNAPTERSREGPNPFGYTENRITPPVDEARKSTKGGIHLLSEQQTSGISQSHLNEVLTPPEHEAALNYNSTSNDVLISTEPNTNLYSSLSAPQGNSNDNNVDMSDYLNFDASTNNFDFNDWYAYDEGAHGESGGFIGEMTLVDNFFSRVGTPAPEEGITV